MTDIAIISIMTKPELAAQMKKSAEDARGELSCSFYIIDNTDNAEFSSAASAYNSALLTAIDSEVYIFCHQDILFKNHVIQDIYYLCKNEKNTLFGAAGVKDRKSGVISSMASTREGWNYTSLSRGTAADVLTLDECLICGSKELFLNLSFDEKSCDGWHLYSADLCMQCHLKGIAVKVFDAFDIVHLSGGKTDVDFYICESKLAEKYRKLFPVIAYTCGWTYTDPVRYACLKIYRRIRFGVEYKKKRDR